MKQKNLETFLYSTVGVAAMFVVLVAVYIVTSAVNVRFDITANKAHTLSPGTKRILANLDSRVTVRFYCTQADTAMPPALRTYARHIEELLHEYEQQAKGKLIIQKLDPKPDSDAEDSARLNGIEGRQIGPFDKIYLGVVASLLDQKFALPWLAPDRERLLEYDLSRAISRVVNRTRPVVGIMSVLPVFGDAPDPLMRPGNDRKEEWAFVTELKKDFNIQEVPMATTKIDDSIQVLLVVHPCNISDQAQYALDQFVLRGGKLIAFLDPHAFFDQEHGPGNNLSVIGDNSSKSSLDKLLKAWGLKLNLDSVVADTTFAGRNTKTGDSKPTLLMITREGINDKEVVTSQIDNLFLPFAGAITGTPAEGLKEIVLVKSSPDAALIDSLMATADSEQVYRNFKSTGKEYPLAVQLSGKFKTAFPAGKPQCNDDKAQAWEVGQLKESTGDGQVVLVGDTDMLNDRVCVSVQKVMGHRMIRPTNGNLNFVQSLVEQFAGDDDLIKSRSRASMSRPFTRLKDMENKAGKQWEEKIRLLESKRLETDQKIKELQTHGAAGQGQEIILSADQERELDNYRKTLVEVGKDLKQVRKNLRQDTDALEFRTKVINIGAMPILVALSGLCLAILKTKQRGAK